MSFNALISDFGEKAGKHPRVAIAAPEAYYGENRRRSHSRQRAGEYNLAMSWMTCLKDTKLLEIDWYAIDDDWQKTGPAFQMWKL